VILLLATALGVSQPAAPQLNALEQQAIVVLGRKLGTWRGSARFSKGRYECVTKHSSGDRAIDGVACGALTQCMSRLQPKVDALLAGNPGSKDREVLMQPINAELLQCVKTTREEGLRQLAAVRAGANL
jgi:hypothetical protein